MKNLITIALIIVFVSSGISAQKIERVYPREINVINGFTRGVVNVFTFWLEVPRNYIIEVNQYPFFGLVSGPMKGLYFSSARVCLSFADLFMLGATGPSAYNPDIFPEYVWNSYWNPYTMTNLPPEYAEMEREADIREASDENMETAY